MDGVSAGAGHSVRATVLPLVSRVHEIPMRVVSRLNVEAFDVFIVCVHPELRAHTRTVSQG